MLIRNALVYTGQKGFEKKDLRIEEERIAEDKAQSKANVTDMDSADSEEVIDAEGLYALPGLVDIHLHGAAGDDLCDADPEALRRIAEFEAVNGIAAFCPAVMTCGEEKLKEVLGAAERYMKEDSCAAVRDCGHKPAAAVAGVRMEGPFLSPRKAGAQDPQFIRSAAPDAENRSGADFFQELQRQYGGIVRILDIAPEEPGCMEMIRELSKEVRISVAHTTADYDTASEAFCAGARQLTHLYNAMPGIHHRSPGPVIAALEYNTNKKSGVSAEIIADGIHIHPAMVRFTFRAFGPENMILISDSMRACGLPAGQYELGGQAVTVLSEKEKKKAVLTDHPETLAGSVASLFDCLRCAVTEMEIPLPDAVRAASENPAKALGIFGDYGTLTAGAYANVVLTDRELKNKAVILRGKPL